MGDSLANAWSGCLGPIIRNVILTGAMFIVAALIAIRFGSWLCFFAILFGGAALLAWSEKRLFAERTRRERLARAEFFGLPDDEG